MYRFIIAALFICASSCAGAGGIANVGVLEKTRALPKKFVILPADVEVHELTTAGALEKLADKTDEAKGVVANALNQLIEKSGLTDKLVDIGTLSEDESAAIERYLALYDTVSGEAMAHTLNPGPQHWDNKAKHFDYTLGPSLASIAERTGADAAIIAYGRDVVSSGGRKMAFIFAAALGVGIPMGHSAVSLGIVDLKTGDLLWLSIDASGVVSFTKPESVTRMFEGSSAAFMKSLAQ